MKRDPGANAGSGANHREIETVRGVLLEQGKIAAVKHYRESKPGLGLAEAKVFVERIEADLPPGQRKAHGCFGVVVLLLVVAMIFLAMVISG